MTPRQILVIGVLIIVTAAVAIVGSGIAGGGGTDVAEGPIPRVCWFSDYANAKLSNQCQFDARERRWYMEVDGRRAPADQQKLPVANLCHYFSGQECPARKGEG